MAEPRSGSPLSSTDWAAFSSHSPASAELLARGRPTGAGQAAALVLLASRGFVELAEKEDGRHELRLKTPAKSRPEALPETERVLLDTLRRGAPPSWNDWKAALRRQSAAEGTLTEQDWRRLERWSFFGPLARRALPQDKARAGRELARRLENYPVHTDPLPQTRAEWDSVLACAVALGRTAPFLQRVRELCEYFERHFQGIVMTFYTPPWYLPLRSAGQDRFAFLTGGMTRLLHGFRWDRVDRAKG